MPIACAIFAVVSAAIAVAMFLLDGETVSDAQTRAETLRYVTGAAVNTLDPTMPVATGAIWPEIARP